ncbi:NAD-dependent succinate-semialdehyde dehydrogenase [Clostridium grantii]|uniref:3-sulfolactaldehyde dehydrogenase n=1 Tax=Clostridium grantii DSM 8605 TaxID=1121316 RepID=A0A1M5U182_9CLOT|nr:NAD-dependent succinate-semialdehyde dehydrogenase [Clostridium grantii]SHH56845.1 succinate-semialdehyde dehydrogenase / glutarate-semialdehyde dehydrogenase [Clostridium grantii DSM 8605]
MNKISFKHLIGGELVDGLGKEMEVYSPITGKVIARFAEASSEQAILAAKEAEIAFKTWSKLSLSQREKYILNFANKLEENKETIIDLLIQETGKAYETAEYDFNMLPDCLRFFIEEAKRLDGSIIPDYDDGHMNMIIRKPVGVVVGYLAWNFPLLNIGYKLGPSLASGCTCVLKPAFITPLASLYVGMLAHESGMPAGVINMIAGAGASISETLNQSTIPDLITLIGSSQTGRKIVEQSATSIKHLSLELGGNAPVIVFDDADIEQAVSAIAKGKFTNSGQVCVAPNRVFVHKNIKDEFILKVKEFVEGITLGSGKDEADFLMGPLSSARAVSSMEYLIEDAVKKGAIILCGGKKAERDGYFFQPTVLMNVTKDMKVYQEEIFGPIMPILEFDENDDPVELANDTIYGLAAYVYTNNLKEALNLARNIDSGSVCVNEPFFTYNMPHGGCKESGVGKDCSRFSLEEYYYVQRISLKL